MHTLNVFHWEKKNPNRWTWRKVFESPQERTAKHKLGKPTRFHDTFGYSSSFTPQFLGFSEKQEPTAGITARHSGTGWESGMSLTSNISCQKEGTGSWLLLAQQLPSILPMINKIITEKNSCGLFALVTKYQYLGFLKDLSWMQLDTALLPRGFYTFQQEEWSRCTKSNQKMTTKFNPE